jgi:hypothetical protein
MKDKADEPWYIGSRAEQMALLWLTELNVPDDVDSESPDDAKVESNIQASTKIVVEQADQDILADLRVTLSKGAYKTSFAVEVKGTTHLPDWLTTHSTLKKNKFNEKIFTDRGLNEPLGLILADVKSREMYFGWVIPPHGNEEIFSPESVRMKLATPELLKHVLSEVSTGFAIETDIRRAAKPGL